ncbi:MAG: 2-oxoacid:acceptor oxidoreductase family protein [Eubacteriales bacterium]|nr:2-oxoacid:acceptor oxidoreductase family protein [Eubacteriales bacterium]
MTHKCLIAGSGGQGIMLIGKILAHSGMREGKHVMFLPSYGSEMRGGTANCSVILSDEEIDAPVIDQPTCLIAMNAPSFDKFEQKLAPKGIVIVNSSMVVRKAEREDLFIAGVPANELAREIEAERVANMIMLGTLIAATQCVTLESVMESLEELLPPHRHHLLPSNQKALEAGMKLVKKS